VEEDWRERGGSRLGDGEARRGKKKMGGPVMARSSLDPLGLITSLDTLGGEELSQFPMLRLTPSIGVRTSRLKWSSARSGMTFSWKDRTGWIHEIAGKIMTTWLSSE
jgi:hypothetical protein